MAEQLENTAGEHTYEQGDIFFSTTDAGGRIQRANSTFMRLSGYPRGALVGRAHNVVRHPDMPAGLFRCMWDDLGDGHAASAYITNRSVDGGYYRVFATIIPLGDGYLSVRTLPMLTERRDSIEDAYAAVRQVEADSAAAGASRREVAAAGKAALVSELEQRGFASTIEFTRRTLPREVSLLVEQGVGLPRVPAGDADSPVGRILAAMEGIESDTSSLVGTLDTCRVLVDLLRNRVSDIEQLRTTLGAVHDEIRRLIAALPEHGAEELRERAQSMERMVLECTEQLHPLSGQVSELRSDVHSVRFGIALMRLHNLAAGSFASQILSGEDQLDANDARASLAELCQALDSGARDLTARLALLDARRDLVGCELDDVATEIQDLRAPLLAFLDDLSARATVRPEDDAAAASSEALRRSLTDSLTRARSLADTASAVDKLDVSYDDERVSERLAQVRAALAELD